MAGKIVIGLAACVAACGWMLFAWAEDKKARMTEHRLIHISPGSWTKPLTPRAGDMIQIEPFTYPTTADFLGAKLQVQLTGDRVLALVGRVSSGRGGEGSGGQSAFLYVVAAGTTTVKVTLLNEDGKPLKGYQATYKVVAKSSD